MNKFTSHFIIILLMGTLLTGCSRGRRSAKPPIHPNPNMDDQEKLLPQSKAEFFKNNSGMRQPVENTVARGKLGKDGTEAIYLNELDHTVDVKDLEAFFTGKDAEGNYLKESPVPFSMKVLERGRERFDIYCAVCHNVTGEGGQSAMVIRRSGGSMTAPPSFHDKTTLEMSDGQIFYTISEGVRVMPGYKKQIPVGDRWAIVGYLRALQRSQRATFDEFDKIKE